MTTGTDDTIVMIGGEAVAIPPLTLGALKRCWAVLSALPQEKDIVAYASAASNILSSALYRARPEMTAEVIEDTMLASELKDLPEKLQTLFQKSGLTAPGEAKPSRKPRAA